MDARAVARLLTDGLATVKNTDAFFTNQDRTTQSNDEYSLKAEIWVKGETQLRCVVHAHLENDAITKAHVKQSHYGNKLFDLNAMCHWSAIILAYALGSWGSYKVSL